MGVYAFTAVDTPAPAPEAAPAGAELEDLAPTDEAGGVEAVVTSGVFDGDSYDHIVAITRHSGAKCLQRLRDAHLEPCPAGQLSWHGCGLAARGVGAAGLLAGFTACQAARLSSQFQGAAATNSIRVSGTAGLQSGGRDLGEL